MTLFYIILLIVLGLVFLLAELLLLPGISVGAILALVSDGSAIWIAFRNFGTTGGVIVLAVVIVLSLLTTIIALRGKTWQRFALEQKIHSANMEITPDEQVKIGARGTTLSRLAPMGKVEIGGATFEAKTRGGYVEQQTEVEVIGFENSNIIVKPIK